MFLVVHVHMVQLHVHFQLLEQHQNGTCAGIVLVTVQNWLDGHYYREFFDPGAPLGLDLMDAIKYISVTQKPATPAMSNDHKIFG